MFRTLYVAVARVAGSCSVGRVGIVLSRLGAVSGPSVSGLTMLKFLAVPRCVPSYDDA